MKKFVEMATIVENTAIIPEVWKMVFQAPKTASEAKAGQFVNVHRDGGQTFLRRPFGIVDADVEAGTVTIIYRLVGIGTEEMKALRPGDVLNVEGPLGDGIFTTTPGKVLLAGGGVGLAPLIFLAKQLDHPIVLVAGKTAAETFWTEFFEPYAEQIYVTTDDGSKGIKGIAVDALPTIFSEHPIALRMVWQASKAVSIPILGLGGIVTWQDAVEFMLAGASTVAVGAHNFVDPRAVETVAEGLDQYCKDQGIAHISDIVGQLEA